MIFHIAVRAEWEAARTSGRYEMSTRGVTLADEGFIHCAAAHQVRGVAERFYADIAGDLVVLEIDPAGLPVREEPVSPVGELFPHLYGPLPVPAVVAVVPYPEWAASPPARP